MKGFNSGGTILFAQKEPKISRKRGKVLRGLDPAWSRVSAQEEHYLQGSQT